MNLSEISKYINDGDLKKIAESAGTTKTAVSRYLNGKTKSKRILIENAALKIAVENKRVIDENQKNYKQLLS